MKGDELVNLVDSVASEVSACDDMLIQAGLTRGTIAERIKQLVRERDNLLLKLDRIADEAS